MARYTFFDPDTGEILGAWAGPDHELEFQPHHQHRIPGWPDTKNKRVVMGPDGPELVEIQATLSERKEKRLKELASRRFSHETKGLVLNGKRIQTDREARSNLQSLFNAADVTASKEFRWKAQDGWVTLNKTKIRQTLAAVVDHVQACFDREEELAALIEASDNPEAVDITSGWPGGDSLD